MHRLRLGVPSMRETEFDFKDVYRAFIKGGWFGRLPPTSSAVYLTYLCHANPPRGESFVTLKQRRDALPHIAPSHFRDHRSRLVGLGLLIPIKPATNRGPASEASVFQVIFPLPALPEIRTRTKLVRVGVADIATETRTEGVPVQISDAIPHEIRVDTSTDFVREPARNSDTPHNSSQISLSLPPPQEGCGGGGGELRQWMGEADVDTAMRRHGEAHCVRVLRLVKAKEANGSAKMPKALLRSLLRQDPQAIDFGELEAHMQREEKYSRDFERIASEDERIRVSKERASGALKEKYNRLFHLLHPIGFKDERSRALAAADMVEAYPDPDVGLVKLEGKQP